MRQIININKDWYFTKEIAFPQKINNLTMENINLPHTWNNIDGTDGGNDYYRGKCIYYKNLNHIDLRNDEEIYLEFDGVNMSIRVFLNNHLVGEHRGGYSRFRFNITKYLNDKDNILVCYVDNSASREIYPQKADFTFYGGIYRDVNLIKVNKSHFQLDYFGGEGLKITPHVDGEVEIEVFTSNSSNHKLLLEIYDSNEELVAKANAIIENEYSKQTLFVKNVHLWNGIKDPYLYKVVAKLDTDIVSASFGFRSFRIDPQKGFYLNDKPYDLIGVSRHQDRALVGSALTKEMHKEDMDIIKEMGATTIRLAHYQHDQYVYDLADQYGFIIWAEIPYITEHMDEAIENTKSQLQELIIQNYNHPSIIVWGLSNEITVVNGCSPSCYKNHEELNALAHSLDKTRLTTMANLFMLETSSPLVKLPDVRSYNLYFGWYVGEKEENDKWLDEFHRNYPELAIGLSEFG
ncbi:MAG: glycoside hydrolase family 2 TIM barrel-domain containing protein, partial [bacterium]|nr:glycoside hydrolase family 2 TIM barrel-domain containing protein [bacterium]